MSAVPYAILQNEITAVEVDTLARAFESIDRLTDHDAVVVARDACGIVMDHLDLADAEAIHRSLASQGMDVHLVDRADLFDMPSPK